MSDRRPIQLNAANWCDQVVPNTGQMSQISDQMIRQGNQPVNYGNEQIYNRPLVQQHSTESYGQTTGRQRKTSFIQAHSDFENVKLRIFPKFGPKKIL